MMFLHGKSKDYIDISKIKDFFFNIHVKAYRHFGHLVQNEVSEYRRNNLSETIDKHLEK